jgi:hypothetical protein
MGKKVKDYIYEEYILKQFQGIDKKYKGMVKDIFDVSEDKLCSTKRGDGTKTLRYVRIIFTKLCYDSGVPIVFIAKILNRCGTNTIYNNIKRYREYYKADEYFTHLADLAIIWDRNH